jgi:hypothetical protein
VTLAFVLIVAGCSTPSSATRPLSARATVGAYFSSVNAGEWKQAEDLLSPSQQTTFIENSGSDRNNTLSVTDLKVAKVRPAPFERGAFPGYTSLQQAFVTFDATYKKVFGVANGPQARFVYVGRAGPTRPWSILAIGSGP